MGRLTVTENPNAAFVVSDLTVSCFVSFLFPCDRFCFPLQTLTTADIHNGEDPGDEDARDSNETIASINGEKQQIEVDVEDQCDATLISSDIESRDTIDTCDSRKTNAETPLPPVKERRCDSEDSENLLAFAFGKDHKVCVPLSGQAVLKETKEPSEAVVSNSSGCPSRRLVSNGCAICLSRFEAGEKITWSSNPDCCHVFHSDCILDWYQAVGRKTLKKSRRDNTNMIDEESLGLICQFPINCPCCRQPFCIDNCLPGEKSAEVSDSTSGGDGDGDGEAVEDGDIETGGVTN